MWLFQFENNVKNFFTKNVSTSRVSVFALKCETQKSFRWQKISIRQNLCHKWQINDISRYRNTAICDKFFFFELKGVESKLTATPFCQNDTKHPICMLALHYKNGWCFVPFWQWILPGIEPLVEYVRHTIHVKVFFDWYSTISPNIIFHVMHTQKCIFERFSTNSLT